MKKDMDVINHKLLLKNHITILTLEQELGLPTFQLINHVLSI